MDAEQVPHPPIVSQQEWLDARKKLLAEEKALTKQKDRVNAQRRRLPMVRIDKEYVFEGPEGRKTLRELFGDKRQLVVYHFMYGPEDKRGCPGCTSYVNALNMKDLEVMGERDTEFVLISRAPLSKLEAYKAEQGWSLPWYSSFGSDFNYDFHVSQDESKAPIEYNYMSKEQLQERRGVPEITGEDHGTSVFFRLGDEVFHTYSAYARGTEGTTDSYGLLDLTPYGRQEDFEESPPGWPQKPTYG